MPLDFDDAPAQGRRANVLVHADAPQHAAMRAWADSGRANPQDWREDAGGRGLWVALSAFQRGGE